MPRPRKTQVASQKVRVVRPADDVPTSTTSKQSKADSMAPLKRPRGGSQRVRAVEEANKIESSGKSSQKKPIHKPKAKGRPTKRKKELLVDRYIDNDTETQEQASALVALKARLSGGQLGHTIATDGRVMASLEAKSAEQQENLPGTSPSPRSRMSTTPQQNRPPINKGRTPSIQIDTDDDLYGLSPAGKASQAKLGPRRSSVPRAPMSVLKVRGTPGMETSMLALQNFKRRARQPSLIRMVQQSSELGREDEEAYLGVELDLDDTLRDFDNFLPEDESTPLNFGKKRLHERSDSREQSAQADGLRTSSSRKRKRNEPEDNIQIPGTNSYGSSPPHIEGTTWERSNRSSSLPHDIIIASTEEHDPVHAEPLSQSDIDAQPRSSNELASPQKPDVDANRSAERATRTAKQHAKRGAKISTAHLQSLLPKSRPKSIMRRVKQIAPYEIPSDSELDATLDSVHNDDELSYSASRRRGTTTRSANKPLATKEANKGLNKKITTTKAKQKRTYGRQTALEKENDYNAAGQSDGEDEDTIEIGGDEKAAKARASKSKELERARKMFAAVDEWEMEFESVDLGGGESSPWR